VSRASFVNVVAIIIKNRKYISKKEEKKKTYLGLERRRVSSPVCPGADVADVGDNGRRRCRGGGVGCHGLSMVVETDVVTSKGTRA
jgi:hypothetical protein